MPLVSFLNPLRTSENQTLYLEVFWMFSGGIERDMKWFKDTTSMVEAEVIFQLLQLALPFTSFVAFYIACHVIHW